MCNGTSRRARITLSEFRKGATATAVVLLAALLGLAAPPPASIPFQKDLQVAQRQAKETGIPVMAVVIAGKGVQSQPALMDRRVVEMSRRFWNVLGNPTNPIGAPLVKKFSLTGNANVLFLDGDGDLLGKVGPDVTADGLLGTMKELADKARISLVDKLGIEDQSASFHKTAIDSLLRLGPSVGELIPLLAHKEQAVRTAVSTNIAARDPAACVIPLLDGMTSPKAEVRGACHASAIAIVKIAGVPPVEFWKEAAESDRKDALDKWRQAAYQKYAPLNALILDFALAKLGKQVEDGDSAWLAVEALKACNGQPAKEAGKSLAWGRPLAASEKARPGDIVQMDHCKFAKNKYAARQTQIICKVLGTGKYEVLEQNSWSKRPVERAQLDVNLLKEGRLVIYRPLLGGQEK